MKIIIFTFLMIAASVANARDVTQLELLRCTSFDKATEKLDCFESLIQEISMVRVEESEDEALEEEQKGFMFGLGKLRKKEKEEEKKEEKALDAETYHANVTKVEEGNYRVLYFYTEEGHVWRQIEGSRFWYPKKQTFNIEINRGRMGVYQLKVDGKGKFTSVRRLK